MQRPECFREALWPRTRIRESGVKSPKAHCVHVCLVSVVAVVRGRGVE